MKKVFFSKIVFNADVKRHMLWTDERDVEINVGMNENKEIVLFNSFYKISNDDIEKYVSCKDVKYIDFEKIIHLTDFEVKDILKEVKLILGL